MKRILIIAFATCLLACSSKSGSDQGNQDESSGVAAADIITSSLDSLNTKAIDQIEPCDYLNKDLITATFETGNAFVMVDNSRQKSRFSKTCSARWMMPDSLTKNKNTGVYSHDLPGTNIFFKIWFGGEYSDKWSQQRVENFHKEGMDIINADTTKANPFIRLEALGEDAAWSDSMSQLSWVIGTYSFDLRILGPYSNEQRLAYAKSLAKQIMSKM